MASLDLPVISNVWAQGTGTKVMTAILYMWHVADGTGGEAAKLVANKQTWRLKSVKAVRLKEAGVSLFLQVTANPR